MDDTKDLGCEFSNYLIAWTPCAWRKITAPFFVHSSTRNICFVDKVSMQHSYWVWSTYLLEVTLSTLEQRYFIHVLSSQWFWLIQPGIYQLCCSISQRQH